MDFAISDLVIKGIIWLVGGHELFLRPYNLNKIMYGNISCYPPYGENTFLELHKFELGNSISQTGNVIKDIQKSWQDFYSNAMKLRER